MFDDTDLATMDFGAMSDEGLIDALRQAHGTAAMAQAAEVFAVRELYRRHRAENAQPGPRAGEFAATEAAVAIGTDEATVGALIDIGLALEERLPRTRTAFANGQLDLAKVRVIVEHTRATTRAALDALEPKLLEAASRTTPAHLRQVAGRWAGRLDPVAAQRRRARRQDDRQVRLRAIQDGMAVFDGLLSASDAQTVAMRLRELSLQVCAQDPRTMTQRRADALVALADGSGRLRCRCGRGARCPMARIPAPTGAELSIREGARYLFPRNDIDAPGEQAAATAPDTFGPDRPAAEDLLFPLAGYPVTHRQLSRIAPEDDLPDDAPTAAVS